jgi:hypothetical protein
MQLYDPPVSPLFFFFYVTDVKPQRDPGNFDLVLVF